MAFDYKKAYENELKKQLAAKQNQKIKNAVATRIEQGVNYSQTRTGKAGIGFSKFFGNFANRKPIIANINRASYGNKLAKSNTSKTGIRHGRRGRPSGTYDKRYAAYGGVYSYRKIMNARLAIAKAQARQRATINPQQQDILNRAQAQQRYNNQNMEAKTIPDTTGEVPLKDIFDEIDQATRIYD